MLTKMPDRHLSVFSTVVMVLLVGATNHARALSIGQQRSGKLEAAISSQTNDLFRGAPTFGLADQRPLQPQQQSQQSARTVINGNHATYVEPPADFKPIIYEPERQAGADQQPGASSNSDLESLDSPNQLLSSAASQAVPVASSQRQRAPGSDATQAGRRQADAASQINLQQAPLFQIQQQQRKNGLENAQAQQEGDKIESGTSTITSNEDESERPSLKPSIGRWSDWTDMSIEPDLASSDTQLSGSAAPASELTGAAAAPSLAAGPVVGAQRQQTPLKTRYFAQQQQQQTIASYFRAPQPQVSLFDQAAAAAATVRLLQIPLMDAYHQHQHQNFLHREHSPSGQLAQYRHHQQQQQAQPQKAIKFAHIARSDNDMRLSQQLVSFPSDDASRVVPLNSLAGHALISMPLLAAIGQPGPLRLANSELIDNYHPSYRQSNHLPLPSAAVRPQFVSFVGGSLGQQLRRAAPVRKSRKSKAVEVANAEVFSSRQQLARAPLDHVAMSHQPLVAAHDTQQAGRVFAVGQSLTQPRRPLAAQAAPFQLVGASRQQHVTNVIPRAQQAHQIQPQTQATNSTSSPSPKRILRRRRIKTQLPVGLSSWFLGGIRDLDGRHWHLPSEVVSKLAVNDVDLQHDSEPQAVGSGTQPGDITNNLHSQVETQGPPVAQPQQPNQHQPSRSSSSNQSIPR